MGRKKRVSRAELSCAICDADAAFLRSSRPPYEALRPRIRVVDLFAGYGGVTLGAAEAARRTRARNPARGGRPTGDALIHLFDPKYRLDSEAVIQKEDD